LSGTDYVYLWVDGIHLKVRLDQQKLCLLVMIGVRTDGRKELAAISDGYRESTESWADLLRDCRRHGMTAPVLAIGDGALGFWKAIREVFPANREQRCWWHKQPMFLPRCRNRRTPPRPRRCATSITPRASTRRR
jgi:transposase-like protein